MALRNWDRPLIWCEALRFGIRSSFSGNRICGRQAVTVKHGSKSNHKWFLVFKEQNCCIAKSGFFRLSSTL